MWIIHHLQFSLGSDSDLGEGLDSWQIPCVLFPFLLAPILTVLATRDSPNSTVFILKTDLLWAGIWSCFKHPLLTGYTHSWIQLLPICSFLWLEYIFLWAQPVLLGYGSRQAREPSWLTLLRACTYLCRGRKGGGTWRIGSQWPFCSVEGTYATSDTALKTVGGCCYVGTAQIISSFEWISVSTIKLDRAWATCSSESCPCPCQGGCNRWSLKVSSNTNQSMILDSMQCFVIRDWNSASSPMARMKPQGLRDLPTLLDGDGRLGARQRAFSHQKRSKTACSVSSVCCMAVCTPAKCG